LVGNLADNIGFALGLGSKSLMLFGLFRLFVDYAAAYTRASDEQGGLLRRQQVIRRVGHELSTPVAEILTYTPELAQLIPQKGMAASYLSATENAGLRMAAILDSARLVHIEDLPFAARQIDPGKLDSLGKTQTISINTLIHIAVMATKATRAESVKYRLEYSRSCCIKCKPGEIVQVIINVLRNSCDALLRADGQIRIKTENLRSEDASLSKVRVVIEDNGEGVDPSVLGKIFEEGFSTRVGIHRGHGLAIARMLTERNNGSLDLHSPIDHKEERHSGTKVTLVFPKVPCVELREANSDQL
jgi:signal transduction histidine kinase